MIPAIDFLPLSTGFTLGSEFGLLFWLELYELNDNTVSSSNSSS
jgi:hypothetical protein